MNATILFLRDVLLVAVFFVAPNTLAIELYNAEQSSSYNVGVASNAIDGNTSGYWSENSITHTNLGDQNIWWRATLGDNSANALSVSVYNRTDCCANRINETYITLLNSSNVEVGVRKITYVPGQALYSFQFDGLQEGVVKNIKLTKESGILTLTLHKIDKLGLGHVTNLLQVMQHFIFYSIIFCHRQY